MIPLQTQGQFEDLLKPIGTNGKPAARAVVVYFTASWCGACKLIDFDKLIKTVPIPIVWYKCDIDENKYTLGYCGLSKIPSFVLIKDGKFLGKFTSSDIGMIFDMLEQGFS
jgi:thioredoxin-like negative regulator of GroEL